MIHEGNEKQFLEGMARVIEHAAAKIMIMSCMFVPSLRRSINQSDACAKSPTTDTSVPRRISIRARSGKPLDFYLLGSCFRKIIGGL